MKSATWILVKTEDELRSGMTVEVRTCGFCGRRERMILLRASQKLFSLHPSGDIVEGGGGGWLAVPGLCLNPRRPVDLSVAIADGRLWRLSDDGLNETGVEREADLVRGL